MTAPDGILPLELRDVCYDALTELPQYIRRAQSTRHVAGVL